MTKAKVVEISKTIAKLCCYAMKIREDSYDDEAANKATHSKKKYVDYTSFYRMTDYQAAEKACEKLNVEQSMAQFICLSLHWANDILEWAEENLGTKEFNNIMLEK